MYCYFNVMQRARGKICIEYSDVTNYNCNRRGLLTIKGRGKICIEYSDVTNYNCNRRGLLTIKGNTAFRQVNKRGYW